MNVTITHKGEVKEAPADSWQATADEMVARLGPWVPGESKVVANYPVEDAQTLNAARAAEATPKADRVNSDFGSGKQMIDDEAKARIEATHEALSIAGVTVDASEQLYKTGTRMADTGYATQRARAAEHAAKQPIADVAAQLVDAIRSEKRKDVEVSAGDFAKQLSINGALRFDGFKVREQAVRGLIQRLKSPALSYVLGLKERMTAEGASDAEKASDRAELLDVLKHECGRFENVKLKLRTRAGLEDCFAIVSPEYAPADAPDVLGDVLASLPSDAKATFAYDPTSTTWEVRASVFTPTPVDEQAVGEAFEGFVSFSSRDNGTRKLGGGGGILLLRCLNASTYEAASQSVSRRHVGRILVDLHTMSQDATKAIHALCQAWGTARGDVIATPMYEGKLVAIEDAIPGFYRGMLTGRKGELLGVLPGRVAKHVEALAMTFDGERRDKVNVTRADLANGFTRYIQDVPASVRRDAERGIGAWMVKREPVSFVAA